MAGIYIHVPFCKQKCTYCDFASYPKEIGKAESYPPMMFIVSDNDMENRYEQTQLTLSTLKHFRYDESKIYYRLMNGRHCQYSHKEEFGKIICEFLSNV